MLKIQKHLPAGTIVLDRATKRNALTRNMIAELQQALHDFHQERSVRAVILAGAGTSFCAGLDLAEMKSTADEPTALEQWYEDVTLYRDLLETMLRFPKPIIAAVDGPALGAGAGLLLAADVVVGTPSATFGVPEPRRGIVAGLVAPLLAFRLGGSWASNLLMTARTVGSDEGLRLGVFHELVRSDFVWARAHQVATECATLAPESLQLTKRLLNETVGEQLFLQLSSGAAASATSRTTEAAREGLAAFLEKRAPKWP